MKSNILLYGKLFRYLISYSWIRFYIDEIKKNIYIKTTDTFIFDINTASLLPVFPFSHIDPNKNPYMPILVDHKYLNPYDNFCGINDYNTPEIYNKGICNLDEFKYRLNIFCSGDDKLDIFKNIDFNKYNIAITGSTMTACLQRRHPLMSLFNNTSLLINFNEYFNEYYYNSDIDIMFKIKNVYEYIDNIYSFFKTISNTLNSFYININNSENVKLVLNKINYLFVTEKYIIDNITIKLNNNVNIINYIKDNIESDEIKDIFKPLYLELINKKLEEHSNILKDNIHKYNDIFTNNNEFKIYIINSSYNINKNIYVDTTYKYNIISKYLIHPLELFQIKTDDFFGTISKFHLPCVRAYYDGNNVYLTPSCISAHLTYMNIDYKYMHGNKDPIDILNKNRMRGFGTWLNNNEKKLLQLYIKEVPFWNNLYTNKIFGPIELNSLIFKPRYYNNISVNNNDINLLNNRYNSFSTIILNNNINNKNTNISNEINQRFNYIILNENNNIKNNNNENNLLNNPEINFISPNIIKKDNYITLEINKESKFIKNDINYDNLIEINKFGKIIPLKKWIIDYTFNL